MKSRHVAAVVFSALVATSAPALAQTYQAVEDETLNVEPFNITVGDLDDMDVVNAQGDEIGEVEDVLMEGGEIAGVAVEVGGFLGIGDKTVVVPLDQLSLQGDDLVTNLTEEELEALPEWDD